MKERPILFSAPMVLAILAGQKTQTRRVIKTQPSNGWTFETPPKTGWIRSEGPNKDKYGAFIHRSEIAGFPEWDMLPSPYGQPGDRLWVRETWQGPILDDDEQGSFRQHGPDEFKKPKYCVYRATDELDAIDEDGTELGWRPSIFMPRWASRILLEIVSVRVERLNDCSEVDAIAEGLTGLSKDGGRTLKYGIPDADGLPGNDNTGWHWQDWRRDARDAYKQLWEQINGPNSWDANPWVWVVEFKRIEQ